MDTNTPDYLAKLKAYRAAKCSARSRQIPWYLSFQEFCTIWEPYWQFKGARPPTHVMMRYWDRGAYEPGNVTIGTQAQNRREAELIFRLTRKGQITYPNARRYDLFAEVVNRYGNA